MQDIDDQKEPMGIDFSDSSNIIDYWWATDVAQPSETQLLYFINQPGMYPVEVLKYTYMFIWIGKLILWPLDINPSYISPWISEIDNTQSISVHDMTIWCFSSIQWNGQNLRKFGNISVQIFRISQLA